MANVIEINDIDSLASYHLDWSILHRKTEGATFFNTLEWLQVYWRNCSEGKKLRTLIVRSGNTTIGIVPLIEQIEPSRLGPIRVLTYPLNDWSSQFVALGSSPTATMAVAMKYLASIEPTWDVFEPRWVPEDNGRTSCAMQIAGLHSTTSLHLETSIIDYTRFEDLESYLAKQTYKSRQTFRKNLRRVEAQENGFSFIRYRPKPFREGGGELRWELFEDCYHVAMKSWQAKATDGNTISDCSVRGFIREAHVHAARLGMLDVCLLYQNKEPVAYYYSYHNEGELIGLRTGYVPEASGAGAMLMASMIKESFQRQDRRLNLGAGTSSYKVAYQTHTEQSFKITHIKPKAWLPLAIYTARKIRNSLRMKPLETATS